MTLYLRRDVRERSECLPCKTQTKMMITIVLIILCTYLVKELGLSHLDGVYKNSMKDTKAQRGPKEQKPNLNLSMQQN